MESVKNISKLLHITVDGKGSLSNNFSVIFQSFVHLLATKAMAKQSRASRQLSGGHWVEYRAEFWGHNFHKLAS